MAIINFINLLYRKSINQSMNLVSESKGWEVDYFDFNPWLGFYGDVTRAGKTYFTLRIYIVTII